MQTNQATHPQNVQNNPVTTLPPSGAPKSLGTGSGPKALGGGGDPALAQWYEQAYAYYNQVQSGQAQMPDQAAWNEFLNQMNWAYQTLNGGGGMPPMGNPAQGPANAMPQEIPYDYESNEITATGEPITHRSWGTDETLIIPSMAAHVEYIWTTDTSVTPAQQVLKVKITNEITGTEEIVTYENAGDPDFNLTIKAADPESVSGNAPNVDITVEKYDMKAAENSEGAGGTASVPGELNEDGVWEYFGEGESTIHFEPVGDPENPQEHVVYGYTNLRLPGGSTAECSMDGEDILVEIYNHKGELTDTIRIKKGYTLDIQGHPEYIYFNGKTFEELGEVPGEFDERVLVGGESLGAEALEEQQATEEAQMAMEDWLESLDFSEEEILNALKQAGYSIDTVEELKEAMINKEFPPEELSQKFINFLYHLDEDFADKANAAATDKTENGGIVWETWNEANDHLAELLQSFYPNQEDDIWGFYDGQIDAGIEFGGEKFVPDYRPLEDDEDIALLDWEEPSYA